MYEALHVPSGVENDSEKDDVYNELIFGTIHDLSGMWVIWLKKISQKTKKKIHGHLKTRGIITQL